MPLIKKILGLLLLALSLHLFYKYVGVYQHLNKRPCSIHSWAQCERASIALNYAQYDMNFFKPKIHKELDGEGITGLEFPFVNYSVAILYKLFGFKEIYYKCFVLFTLILGLTLFYFLNYSFTKNYFISLLSVGSAYISPVLIYYSANFLPDTTSLGFVLVAWFFFFKYLKTNKSSHLWLFFSFALIAALVKISSLIFFGVLIGITLLDYLKFFNKTNNHSPLFNNKPKILGLSLLALFIVIAWYKYANWLSEYYHSDAFLLSHKLVTDKAEALAIWRYIERNWIPHYYKDESYILIFWYLISLFLLYKFVNRLLFTITLLTILGSAAFVFLMFFQFKNHDYYIITLLPSVFLLFLTFSDMIVRLADNYFPPLKFIIVLVIFFNAKEGVIWCKKSYMSRHETAMLAYTGDYRPYEELEPKLRKLGLKKTDITVVAFDGTYCNSLYLMNQRGWNIEYTATKEYAAWIMDSKKPQYLVLSDSAAFNKLYPNNFVNNIIGYHRGLIIYKLK